MPDQVTLDVALQQLKVLRQGAALAHPTSVLRLDPDLRRQLADSSEVGTAAEVVGIARRLRELVNGLDSHERLYAEVDLNLAREHNHPTLTERQESLARTLKCASKTVRRHSERALDTLALLIVTNQRSVSSRAGPEATEPSSAERVFGLVSSALAVPDREVKQWGSLSRVDTGRTATDLRSLGTGHDAVVKRIGQALIPLQQALRMSDAEVQQIGALAGHVVELSIDFKLVVDASGAATASYRHAVVNLSDSPVTRLAREVWFKHSKGHLDITATAEGDRKVIIQRVHDTPGLVKFACRMSPALEPGESGVVSYFCTGGIFLDEFYWRQAITRYTRHLTMLVEHRGLRELRDCDAVLEHPDGTETSAASGLIWDGSGAEVRLSLTADHLRPNQAVTIRWDGSR